MGLRRVDRAAEHRGDELGEHLVGEGVGIGGALEGQPVERGGDRGGQRRGREAELEAELLRDPLEGVGEGVADRVAALRELSLQLGVADAERPELVEEQRPVRVGLEKGAELLGRLGAGVALPSAASATAPISATRSSTWRSAIARNSSSLPAKFEYTAPVEKPASAAISSTVALW